MYYNKVLNKLSIDAIDCFMLCFVIFSYLGSYLKDYVSEKQADERLKQDIIKQCRLIESSKRSTIAHKFATKSRLHKVYRVAFNVRGGTEGDNIFLSEQIKFLIAEHLQLVAMQFAAFLKENEFKVTGKKQLQKILLKILISQSRLAFELILSFCNIDLQYIILDKVSNQFAVTACVVGGTTGFASAWLKAGGLILGPPTILSIFLIRSGYQQILHNAEYEKWRRLTTRLLDDSKIRQGLIDVAKETQQELENSASKKLKFEDLNWNKNPKIREIAEKLGIFEDDSIPIQIEGLETLDSGSDKNFQLHKNSKERIQKPKVKGKTVHFRDFIRQFQEDENNPELNIIDAEIVKKRIIVPIKNGNN